DGVRRARDLLLEKFRHANIARVVAPGGVPFCENLFLLCIRQQRQSRDRRARRLECACQQAPPLRVPAEHSRLLVEVGVELGFGYERVAVLEYIQREVEKVERLRRPDRARLESGEIHGVSAAEVE